jgi:hypothetical protein
MIPEMTKDKARKYYVKLTRKLPNSNKRVYKSEEQLQKEIANRRKNWNKGGPKCFRPTIAITEEKKHHGTPCKKGEERTANFCIKQLNVYDRDKTRWVRTLTPNNTTRIRVACPK